MSEKPPVNFDSSRDASLEELQSLVDQGLKDNAVTIAKFKLGELESVLSDVAKVLQGQPGEISEDDWRIAKSYILEQIKELKAFIDNNQ